MGRPEPRYDSTAPTFGSHPVNGASARLNRRTGGTVRYFEGEDTAASRVKT